ETNADGVAGGHDNRYRAGGFMRGEAGRGAPGHDQVDRKIDQLGRQGSKSLRTRLCKTVLEAMTLSLDITQIPQPIPQSLERWPGLIRKNTNFPKAARRLRAERQRPSGRRTADERDELAPPHGAYPKANDHGLSIAGRDRASQQKRRLMSEMGHKRPIETPPAVATCPLRLQ